MDRVRTWGFFILVWEFCGFDRSGLFSFVVAVAVVFPPPSFAAM